MSWLKHKKKWLILINLRAKSSSLYQYHLPYFLFFYVTVTFLSYQTFLWLWWGSSSSSGWRCWHGSSGARQRRSNLLPSRRKSDVRPAIPWQPSAGIQPGMGFDDLIHVLKYVIWAFEACKEIGMWTNFLSLVCLRFESTENINRQFRYYCQSNIMANSFRLTSELI